MKPTIWREDLWISGCNLNAKWTWDIKNSSGVYERRSKTGLMSGASLLNLQGTSGTRNLIRKRNGSKKQADSFKKRSLIKIMRKSLIRNLNKIYLNLIYGKQYSLFSQRLASLFTQERKREKLKMIKYIS